MASTMASSWAFSSCQVPKPIAGISAPVFSLNRVGILDAGCGDPEEMLWVLATRTGAIIYYTVAIKRRQFDMQSPLVESRCHPGSSRRHSPFTGQYFLAPRPHGQGVCSKDKLHWWLLCISVGQAWINFRFSPTTFLCCLQLPAPAAVSRPILR